MAEQTEHGREQNGASQNGTDYTDLTQTVRDLVKVMQQGEIERLEISSGDLHILLCARSANAAPPAAVASVPAAPVDVAQGPAADGDEGVEYHHITSPMVGTFYEAPSPGDPPFVRAGDNVEIGQTVAIIEAMKIMNEIVADRPGIVDAILVENGEAVEYGHPLFRIRPD